MSLRLVICLVSISVLAGCASNTPAITKSTNGEPRLINEAPFYPAEGALPFKFRSFGHSTDTYERDLKPVEWKKVDEFEVGKFIIALHAKLNEVNILAHFLELPYDNLGGATDKTDGSKREVLIKVISENDALVKHIFEKKAVRAKVNFYFAIYDTEVKTPVTTWQYGPIIDPVELNLAEMLPPLGEKYERDTDFDDTRWYGQIMRTMLHEYAHVVHINEPSAFKTLLADEFTAATVDRCASYGVHRFRNEQLNSGLIRAGVDFSNDREFIIRGKPFTSSTTGGQLAGTAIAALFSRGEMASAPRERWVEVLPQYCKMIVDAKPAFATSNEGLDWIDTNIKNAKLPFLEGR